MKVTVITVAYNSSKTLADAIESVLRQTYRDIMRVLLKDVCIGFQKKTREYTMR